MREGHGLGPPFIAFYPLPRRCLPLTSLGFMERPLGGSPEYCRAQHPRRARC